MDPRLAGAAGAAPALMVTSMPRLQGRGVRLFFRIGYVPANAGLWCVDS